VGSRELIWYLAVTEWIVLSLPLVHFQIEEEIRSGDIAYRLARPVSYAAAKFWEAAGETALRLLSLGVAGVALAWLCAGGPPADPRGLLLALPLGIVAAAVMLAFHATIGLAAFWLQDCSPLYWMWQKASFVLGGLFLPLEIYPAWLQQIALWTPFSAVMYGPGRMAFGLDPGLALWTVLKLVVWGAVAASLLVFTYRRALRVLDINGG
jgi:ABC-2 type transport system permease protein